MQYYSARQIFSLARSLIVALPCPYLITAGCFLPSLSESCPATLFEKNQKTFLYPFLYLILNSFKILTSF
jgi:hypothetical protein